MYHVCTWTKERKKNVEETQFSTLSSYAETQENLCVDGFEEQWQLDI